MIQLEDTNALLKKYYTVKYTMHIEHYIML